MLKIQKIETCSISILKQCLKISLESFGENYHNHHFFNSEEKIKIIALTNHLVIGFLIAKKINIKTIKIESIVVKKQFQSKSVGTSLMRYFFKHFTSEKTKIIAHAWKSLNGIHAKKLFEKFDLKAIKNNGYIWKKECDIEFKCSFYKNQCCCQSVPFAK